MKRILKFLISIYFILHHAKTNPILLLKMLPLTCVKSPYQDKVKLSFLIFFCDFLILKDGI